MCTRCVTPLPREGTYSLYSFILTVGSKTTVGGIQVPLLVGVDLTIYRVVSLGLRDYRDNPVI